VAGLMDSIDELRVAIEVLMWSLLGLPEVYTRLSESALAHFPPSFFQNATPSARFL